MKQFGFKKTLLFSMVCITALSVGTSSYFNYQAISTVFKQTLYQGMQDRVQLESDRLVNFINTKSQAVSKVAQDYQKYGYTEHHAERMRIAANAGDIANLTIGFSNGDAYCSADLPGWENHKNPPSYDPTKRPWYSQAIATSGLIYTEPYEDATTKELMVSIGQKVDSNGVVLADIPLTILKKAVQSFDLDGAVAVIMNQDDTVLASTSTTVKVGTKLTSIPALNTLTQKIKMHESAITDYHLANTDKVMFSERIKYGDRNWYLLVGLDKSIVFKALDEIKNQTIILTIVYVVLSAVITIIILN
ncbi:PDC sensor domain-containing protein, partial [Vibrio sp.]|nr:PDC sensor domain-containing protein [Vibrio sp.]